MIIGAIKIKDGLFIGDEFASKVYQLLRQEDLEFVVSNKVTHIINCAAKQLPNIFESFGVQYLKFNWLETDQQVLFDTNSVNDIFNFVEKAHSNGESVLVHSLRGQSRSCCALAAYFMRKYKWKLYKTLEFLNTRRPDLEIRASFYHQLTQLENRLNKRGDGALSSSWNPTEEQELPLEEDEKLLRNTFQNSKQSAPADCWLDRRLFIQYLHEKRTRQIQWADEHQGVRKSQKRMKSGPHKPIMKQQIVDKIGNINGNVFHVTVNNYLTVKDEEQNKSQNAFPSRENAQIQQQKGNPQIKRQQNDSLKKHLEEKQKLYGKSKSNKIQKRDFSNNKDKDKDDRPKSAIVPPPVNNDFNKPVIPNTNYRQYSPIVKGSSLPKPTQLIATQKNRGWRYPSPGQVQKDDSLIQSIINNKPCWK